jgi:histidinol-phosphate aminotransferase
MLGQAYLSAGDEAIATEFSFLIYRIVTMAANARPVLTRETNYRVDVDAMIAALSPRTRIVYLCNPSNPTGTYLSKAEVERLHAALPSDVLLVIDAAYGEYATAVDYAFGDWLVRRSSNVVMTRTFSKIYGLAALRIGWAYAPPAIVDVVNRIRMPFNASRSSQMSAIAALKDKAHIAMAQRHNAEWRPRLAAEIAALGINVVPSQANFLMLDFTPFGPGAAQAADAVLKSEGLILRPLGGYGIPNALRLTIGLEEANRAVVETLTKFVRDRKIT